MSFKKCAMAAVFLALTGTAQAETCGNSAKGFDKYMKSVKREADTAGVSAQSVAVLNDIRYDASIIKKDKASS